MSENRLKEINSQIPKIFEKIIGDAEIGDIPEIIEALAQVDSETERQIYIEKLCKKFGISRRSVLNDVKKENKSKKPDLNFRAQFPGLIEIVEDDKGSPAFLVKTEKGLLVSRKYEVDGTEYHPPEKANLPFILPKAEDVIYWYDFDSKELFSDIIEYFKRFSFLQDKYWQIVALTVFLSYIQDHPNIHYLPILLFYAVPERGKSRSGKAFTYVSFRGVHIVELREANLFRYSQDLQATLFLDIKDLWRKAERNGAEDILLLRYEKGARVSRVLYPERGSFKDMVHYSIYGPTVIATNEAVHKILDSRCIPIVMPNKPKNYENPTPDKAKELKGRLTAWRARIMDMPLPDVEVIPELSGRLWDISEPLLRVCRVVNREGFETLKKTLIEIAGSRLEDKKGTVEGQIISVLYELSPEGLPEWSIKTSEVLNRINDKRPETYKLSPQYLGKRLKAMGLSTKVIMGYSEIRLKRTDFDLLCIQYGVIENNDILPPEKTLLNSTTLSKQGLSTVYDSRELVESQGNSTETLLTESLENKGFERLVDSSRESAEGKKKIILKTLKVLYDEV